MVGIMKEHISFSIDAKKKNAEAPFGFSPPFFCFHNKFIREHAYYPGRMQLLFILIIGFIIHMYRTITCTYLVY